MDKQDISTRPPVGRPDRSEVFERLDAAHIEVCRAERERLRAIREADLWDYWKGNGARSHAEFLAGRYGISQWKARRWIGAAFALEHLPLTEHALMSGQLSFDKTVELTRFATPATEKKLISWAKRVTPAGIRQRADLETRLSQKDAAECESERDLQWSWLQDGRGLQFEGRMPPADAAVFIASVDRLAKNLPVVPTDDGESEPEEAYTIAQRRADALVMICSARIANDQDPDRATVVVHAPYEIFLDGSGPNATIAGGPPVHAAAAQRLLCDGRTEFVLYGHEGTVGIGRDSREPPPWLRRQVLARDSHSCTFSGCEMKMFLHVHHIRPWRPDGHTDLDNLITLCTTHHKLVHELGWGVKLDEAGAPIWIRPDGRRLEPGPAPPPSSGPEPEPIENPSNDAWPAAWHWLQGEGGPLSDNTGARMLLMWGVRRLTEEGEESGGMRNLRTRDVGSPVHAGETPSALRRVLAASTNSSLVAAGKT